MSITLGNRLYAYNTPSRHTVQWGNLASLTGSITNKYYFGHSWNGRYAFIDITDPNAGIPNGFSTVNTSPSGIASQWVDYQEYFGHRKGFGNIGNGYNYGIVYLQNWGQGGTGLLYNSGDAVAGTNGVYAPYCASGIAGWRSWTENFVSGILSFAPSRTGIYSIGMALPHIALVSCDQRNTTGFISYWSSVTGDARYATETVARVNGTGYSVSGLYSRFVAEGGTPPTLGETFDHSSNASFSTWWFELAELIKDYAIYEAFVKPMVSGLGVNLYGYVDSRLPATSGMFYYDPTTSGIKHTNRYNTVPSNTVNTITIQNVLSNGDRGSQNATWSFTNNNNILALASGSNKTNYLYFGSPSGTVNGSSYTLPLAVLTSGVHTIARFGVKNTIASTSINFYSSGANILFSSTGVNTVVNP